MGTSSGASTCWLRLLVMSHTRTGKQLLDVQTLAEAGVTHGDDLRLQPEITAGGTAG